MQAFRDEAQNKSQANTNINAIYTNSQNNLQVSFASVSTMVASDKKSEVKMAFIKK